MNRDEAKRLLLAYRPDSQDEQDPEITAALALARSDPELQGWLSGTAGANRSADYWCFVRSHGARFMGYCDSGKPYRDSPHGLHVAGIQTPGRGAIARPGRVRVPVRRGLLAFQNHHRHRDVSRVRQRKTNLTNSHFIRDFARSTVQTKCRLTAG